MIYGAYTWNKPKPGQPGHARDGNPASDDGKPNTRKRGNGNEKIRSDGNQCSL